MDIKPITREEMYLAKAAGQDVSPPEPITRKEMFLAKIAGMEVETPGAITRIEMFANKAAVAPNRSVIEPLEITENGTYTAPEGVDGYNPVTVEVVGAGGGSGGGLLATPIQKTGKFKATSLTGSTTITHGLGVSPDCVVVWGRTTAQNAVCYLCGFRKGIPTAPSAQEYVRNTSSGLLRGGINSYIDEASDMGAINSCDESSFKVGGMLCQFDTAIEYTWIVVRHTEY